MMNPTERATAIRLAQHTEPDPRRERRVALFLELWSWRIAGLGAFFAMAWLAAQAV